MRLAIGEEKRKRLIGSDSFTSESKSHYAMSGSNASERVDALLRILGDKQKHSVSELASLLNLSAEKIEELLRFLAKYQIISYDEVEKTAMINAEFLALT